MSRFEMKFDGDSLLKDLKTLKNVKSMKDVSDLTHTQFPGTHCPLLGAVLVTRGIKDCLAFVVGTDECVYYSKSMTMAFDGFGGLKGRCVSVRLDTNDVTFGSAEKVEIAFKEMMEEYNPSCVFLISTCVIEIIGDDFDAFATKFQKEYNIPVLPVHTEHFKCENHLPGVERGLAVCAEIMEKQVVNNSVNILGQHLEKDTDCELYKILEKENIEINIQFPHECCIEEVKTLTKARLNIVLSSTALALAKKMQEKFGTPYIHLEKSCSYETNYNQYSALFSMLDKEVPDYIKENFEKYKKLYEENKEKYKGLSFIYSGAPFETFETLRILCELGLKPLLLRFSELDEKDFKNINEITKQYDPYVTRIANKAGMNHVYDTLKPDISFGGGFPDALQERKIAPLRFMNSSDMYGFQFCELFFDSLEKAKIEVESYRSEK